MDLTPLAQRLDVIEKFRIALLVVAIVNLYLIGLGILIRLRRPIVLRNRKGVARLVMGLNAFDEPEIVVRGREGQSNAHLTCDSEGLPCVSIVDPSGRDRLSLHLAESGPDLRMYGPGSSEGGPWLWLDGRHAAATLWDRPDRERTRFGLDDDRVMPCLLFLDGQSSLRLGIGLTRGSDPIIAFLDRQGNRRIGLGFDEAGAPILEMLDEHGNVVHAIRPARSDPSSG